MRLLVWAITGYNIFPKKETAMKTLLVIAGGECSRMGDFLKQEFHKFPKHILPLPTRGLSLIEAIVQGAKSFFDEIVIEANYQTAILFEAMFNGDKKVVVNIDDVHSGPLGPVARRLETDARVYACAGDIFCDFNWKDFEDFHNSHNRPISLLVAKSMAVPNGARFIIGLNNELLWERVEHTAPGDLINIGAYILDKGLETANLFNDLNQLKTTIKHKEDGFFDAAIRKGCVYAYNPGVMGFNINTPLVYQGLCEYLRRLDHK